MKRKQKEEEEKIKKQLEEQIGKEVTDQGFDSTKK